MEVLITEIVMGERAPGERLPREADLAEQFDVSRGVARECIRAMEERGMISVKHGKGATVNGPDRWNMLDADVLSAILQTPRRSEALSQYVECRSILEVEAAAIAAERATDADVDMLRAALAAMEEAALLPHTKAAEDVFHESDIAFHQALIAATGNLALGSLVETIHGALLAARYPLARPQYRLERAIPEHRRILQAVAAGDPAAAREAMSAHLSTVASYIEDTGRPASGRRRMTALLPS
jgi:GntR family transcriptional repressor for pyruvate dehydrogenase complex